MSVRQPIVRSNALPPFIPDDWHYRLSSGRINRKQSVFVFGRNTDVGTSLFEPIADAGVFWTPQASSASTLYVQSSSTSDTAAGVGAREITIEGINALGELVSDSVATNGTTASSATSNSYMRVLKASVSKSGTYGTQSVPSHIGTITVRDSATNGTRAQISSTGFPRGASQIGVYTIPVNKRGYIEYLNINVDSNKTANVVMFKRGNILQSTAPYDAIQVVTEFPGVSGGSEFNPSSPINSLTGPCDIGFMGVGITNAAGISVAFELILEDI